MKICERDTEEREEERDAQRNLQRELVLESGRRDTHVDQAVEEREGN